MPSDLRTVSAETCFVDKVTDQGAGSVWYVRLGDGYLLECSSSQRAEFVRDCINSAVTSKHQTKIPSNQANDHET
jgi:hypothetical protein